MSNEKKLNPADAIVQMWDIIDRAHPLDKPALKMALAALHEKEHNCENCQNKVHCEVYRVAEFEDVKSITRCDQWERETE